MTIPGGHSPAVGAKVGIWLATSKDVESVTNKFYEHNLSELQCEYRDPNQIRSLISALERYDRK